MGEKAPCGCLRCLDALWRRHTQPAPGESAPPSLPTSAEEAPPTNTPDAAPIALWRILIVEDDTKVAEIIQAALRLEGNGAWEVRIAPNGEEALKLVDEQPVDLILLDMRLPGISGAEVYRRLRSAPATQRLPIIFLSGGTTFDLSIEGVQEGILLRKPFDVSELVAVVRANLPDAHSEQGQTAGK